MLTKKRCDELFVYRDGVLFRKQKVRNAAVGSVAGSKHSAGYFHVRVDGKRQLWHRIIFLMHFNWLPKTIDHIDGDPSNNKIENLRAATMSQNQYNRRTNTNLKNGFKNIRQIAPNRWLVRLHANGKYVLGKSVDNFELAQLLAEEARDLYHNNFAKHF
jgi:hypothetical protein